MSVPIPPPRKGSRAAWRSLTVLAAALWGAPTGSASAASGLFNLALLADNRERIDTVQDAAEQVLPRLTRGTTFANRWAINPRMFELETSAGTFSFDRSHQDRRGDSGGYTGGCQTFVPFKLIICDVQAFDDLMHRWGFDRRTDLGGHD